MSVSPPRPKGPALNALRAFEAAARLNGFAAAAEELGVTAGAVSQHIRTLEDWTGVALFERRAQGVALTPAGAMLQPDLMGAFDQMARAVRKLNALRPDPVIQIAALPSVAQLWLQPRLPALRAALPGIRLSVTALETPPNLRRDLFDLSLFIRTPSGSDNEVVLAKDALLPVCTAELAKGIKAPGDLGHTIRIHDASWANDWADWAAASCDLRDPSEGPRYSLYSMALEEAKLGAGVLMGHAVLVSPELKSGALVPAWDHPVETGKALILEVSDGKKSTTVRRLIEAISSNG